MSTEQVDSKALIAHLFGTSQKLICADDLGAVIYLEATSSDASNSDPRDSLSGREFDL